MKNKRALKFAAVGLCASLMLAGCGGGGSKKETSSGSGDSDTVSFKVTTVYFGDKAPTDTRIQEEWIKLCEEKMGKNLDITFEYIHTGDYTEKLQVINAGGELPDILTVYSMRSDHTIT